MRTNAAGLLIGLLAVDLIIALTLLSLYVMRLRRSRREEPVALVEPLAEPVAEVSPAKASQPDIMRTPTPMDSMESAQVRTALQACIGVLRSVLDGDLDARMNQGIGLTMAFSEELNELSYYLNTALDHLLNQLDQARNALEQGSATQRAWEAYASDAETIKGFRYEQGLGVSEDNNAWLPAMSEVTRTHKPSTQASELAVPLSLGAEIIGALGLQRDAGQTWSEEELLLVQDVVDQLTQTIDRLRLVDDVSRRAALEQTTGAVTASIRSEVEIEGVLQRALAELGQALQADAGSVYLTIDPQQETV